MNPLALYDLAVRTWQRTVLFPVVMVAGRVAKPWVDGLLTMAYDLAAADED